MTEGLSPQDKEKAIAIRKSDKHWGEYVNSDNEFAAYVEEARPAQEYLLALKSDKEEADEITRKADVEAIDRVLSMMPQAYLDSDEYKTSEATILSVGPTSASTLAEDNRLRHESAVEIGARHKDKHLGEYIETARQEAEAQGIQINMGQPKE